MNPLLPVTQLVEETLEQIGMMHEDNAKIGMQDHERIRVLTKALNTFLEGEK